MKTGTRRKALVIFGLACMAVLASKPSTRTDARSANAALGHVPGTGARQAAPVRQADQRQLVESYGKLPLSFEANRGQTDGKVKFLSRGNGYTLFLADDEAVLSLRSQKSEVRSQKQEKRPWSLVPGPFQETKDNAQGTKDVLRMKLVGANRSPQVTALDELPGKSNYFIGNDPSKWETDVRTYAKVKYTGVYPGVDLVYYGNQRQLEYDFVVAPGADPKTITLDIETRNSKFETGQSQIQNPKSEVDTNGDLVVEADGGEVRFRKPVVYQPEGSSRKLVEGRYVLTADNRVGFQVASYDKTKPLVIDPVLAYSTYLGGSDGDEGHGIAVDSSGNAYVTGGTSSTDFPTANAIQTRSRSAGHEHGFVTKFNADGSALVYSTYLGGTDADWGNGIAVDSSGNAYLTGFTRSTDFPTVKAFQSKVAGGPCGDYAACSEAFVTKLNASGNALVYSTYLGGSGNDEGKAIAVDSSGSACVAGSVGSADFPTTTNAFQTTGGGFVAKFAPNGRSLLYSTRLGGSGYDVATGIAVDSAGNAYITGETTSTDFPTVNPLQPALGGGYDAFVTKVAPDGSSLVYSTYLGGSGDDEGTGIAVDSAGNAYLTGGTSSTNFPTANAIQATYGGGAADAYVAVLTAAGNTLRYSTYLGGTYLDVGIGIALDSSGNAYLTGTTFSPNFPTAGPPLSGLTGQNTAFVASVTAAGSALVYSTYLGGSGGDVGRSIALDSSGNTYVTGYTASTDFPTANAIQPTYAGGVIDAFVAKISGQRAQHGHHH